MSKPSLILGIAAAGLILAGNALAGANTNLPFEDTFEEYPADTPLINGTNGWFGSSSNIVVQTNIVRTGIKAAMIPVDCTLSNRFEDMAFTNIWIRMDLRPSLFDGTNRPLVDTNVATMLFVNSNGNYVVHNGPATNPSPTNSASWVVTTNAGIATNGTNWVRIGIYIDFTQTNWDLYSDGELVTNNIGFINTNLTNFAQLDVYNGATTSYLDNVFVCAPGTITVDPTNVIIDAQQGGSPPTNQICLLTAQTGAWNFSNSIPDAATNWLNVNPVTGFVDSAAAGTNLVVSCTNMPDGVYTADITINAINSNGVPRTRTITVTYNVMGLTVVPDDLSMTNGFMFSNNLAIPSQSFMITNKGTLDVNYTVQPQGDTTNWLSVSTTGGTVAASMSTNITVDYSYEWIPQNYTGEIWVASQGGGGATTRVSVAMQVVARPVIELNPSVLTQTVVKGANPVFNEFTIRNGSTSPAVPMAYALTVSNRSPELILSVVDSGGGQSSGQSNLVTINFIDISLFDAGIYTAIVHVTAFDAGSTYTPTGTVQLSTNLVVEIEVAALDAPAGITASDGTYSGHVAINWNPMSGAVNYRVYRFSTFDSTMAELIGEPDGTDFEDLTGQAGVLYYYWVSTLNEYGGEGAMSTNRETGYRGLAAPGGIFATDGAYTNKVRVTWPLVDGATGYQLYRGAVGGILAPLYFTAGGVYEDTFVSAGVHYEYKVAATNGIFGSALSVSATGYAFGIPGGFTASKGAYVGKVRLTWSPVDSASQYEVWRSLRAILPPKSGAVKMSTVTTPVYEDSSVTAGEMYYYWVRAIGLEAGIGGWSAMDRGYGASGGIDLWVNDLVVLPLQIGAGEAPAIVSFRIGNAGGTNMAGANGTVGIEFFASTHSTLDAGGAVSIGKVAQQLSLNVGADTVVKVAGSHLTMPVTEDDYYVFVRALPEPPSLLADTNPNDNVTMRKGKVRVRSGGGMNYQAFNDYDGDGMADIGVYRDMEWSIKSLDNRVLIEKFIVFSGAGKPVLGDLDGDGYSDPMVYDTLSGLWQVLLSGSNYKWISGFFGVPGYRGLVADYEGVGYGDVSVFHEANGRWFVLKSDGILTAWNWGASGYEPVIGDYNGDGCWDMAVYQETTGLWYIRTLDGQLLVPGVAWGGPGMIPVAGDYDGDGVWDAALYQRATGRWFIASLDGQLLAPGIEWGGAGYEPVMGDYDGDGKWDLAVYHEATGLWYIRTLEGEYLAWADPWGGPGYRPIGN